MAMTVKELIEELQELPPDAVVILQKDGEGNGYSPLYCVDPECIYEPDSTWSGTIYDTRWSAADADMSEDEWAEIKARPRCVVLAPTN